MKSVMIAAMTLSLSSTVVMAQVAYPDNWAGGPPLPPLGATANYVVQPQVQHIQPQLQHIQPQVQYAQPQVQYSQPQVRYTQPQPIASSRTYGAQPGIVAVHGPAGSRCIVAILNGERRNGQCGNVWIAPGDQAYLRQKFSAYRPNSGYVLNLPSDDEYSGS